MMMNNSHVHFKPSSVDTCWTFGAQLELWRGVVDALLTAVISWTTMQTGPMWTGKRVPHGSAQWQFPHCRINGKPVPYRAFISQSLEWCLGVKWGRFWEEPHENYTDVVFEKWSMPLAAFNHQILPLMKNSRGKGCSIFFLAWRQPLFKVQMLEVWKVSW